ncbi:MAG: translation initiation factor IF-2, partial [Armatimonadetes bacterium]|nr:translation initiation factor IF-2 [Armatimonadota bacterium]
MTHARTRLLRCDAAPPERAQALCALGETKWNEVNRSMAATRVSELAKELGMTTAEMMTSLTDLGVPVPGPAAIVDADTAQALREMFAPGDPSATRTVELSPSATVTDFADAIGVSPSEVQKKLMSEGILASVNQRLAADAVKRLTSLYSVTLKMKVAARPAPAPAKHRGHGGPQTRPPVVTIMGHVDHGKTTLLDSIRNAHVVDGEFGGITQHIGAYQTEVESEGEKRKITFLDTPGHAAFTAMRARGASVTDIAVLIVAADDGVMPQTIEAIDHARAADVPIIVAINKMDRPDANADKIKTQLTEHNLVPREYGGDVECVPISAKTGSGIEDLLEHILFVADVRELKADPHGRASGTIVEARQEVGRGAVATALVREGTLRVGDCVVSGLAFGKIKAMSNDRGERLHKATPAMPVEVIGLSSVPQAGDTIEAVKDEREARQITTRRAEKQRNARLASSGQRITLEDMSRRIREGEAKELLLVVKGDVQGSVEAVVGALQNLPQDEIGLRVIHSGVGAIGENDVMLASASGAVILGFNVRSDQQAQSASEREHVDIRTYQVIYEL